MAKRGGGLLFFFFALFAPTFTVLLLHFSPLATFDALGPCSLSPLCALFFFPLFFCVHLCRFPSEPPLCLSAAVPLPPQLVPPLGLWMRGCMGNASTRVTTTLPGFVQAGQTLGTPTQPLHPQLNHFSPSLRLFDVSATKLDHYRKVGGAPGSFDCSGRLCMGLKDGHVVGRTPSLPPTPAGPMHLYGGQWDWPALWLLPGWLRPCCLSFPFPSSGFLLAFVFQA